MDAQATGARRSRPTSLLVFLALVTLVVTAALGSRLVGDPGSAGAVTPTAWLESDAAGRMVASEELRSADFAAPELQGLPVLRDAASAAAGDVGGSAEDGGASTEADDALIVRTASLELESTDVAAALAGARAAIIDLGGYVSGSDAYDQGETRWATVTYRVPVDRFADAIEALRGLSDRVVHEATGSSEVSGQVMDLDARITNLRASEAALVEIMDRAGRIDDVLAVQTRLEAVRGQIEQLDAERTYLADQAALSTLSATWSTPVAAVTAAQQGWDLAAEVDAALAQTVQAMQGLAGMVIWLAVVAVPLAAIPLLVIALLLAIVMRRSQRRNVTGSSGDPRAAGPAPLA